MTDGGPLRLSTLPFDIIRIIIRLDKSEHTSLENLRLISRSWNSLSLDFIKFRSKVLLVDHFLVHSTQDNRKLNISFSLKSSALHYFPRCSAKWGEYQLDGATYMGTGWKFSDGGSNVENEENDSVTKHISRILSIFRRFRRLEIITDHQRFLAILGNTLREDMQVDEFIIDVPDFGTHIRKFTLDLTKTYSFNELSVNAISCETSNIGEYLLKICCFVPSFSLRQMGSTNALQELFSKPSNFWIKIAEKMIEYGMKSVTMDNRDFVIMRQSGQ